MTFITAEAARPKIPHKLGLECLGCGATEAAEWRGPGGRYGSCCRKKADAARRALDADPRDKLLEEMRRQLEATVTELAVVKAQLKRQDGMLLEHDAELDAHADHLKEDDKSIKALEKQVAQVSQRQLMQPNAGMKRPALGFVSGQNGRSAGSAPPALR